MYKPCYYVYINKRYMTVTLDGFVADLLSIQLGFSPDDDKNYYAICEWIEKEVRFYPCSLKDDFFANSHWLTHRAILAITAKYIADKYHYYLYCKRNP